VTDGTTPDNIAYASFYLAGAVAQDADAAESTGTGSNVKEAKAGSAAVSFFSGTLDSGTRLPQPAHDFLGCYLESAATIITPVSTGVSDDSEFDCDDFERSEGYS
jgi:hypothetical protein